MERLQDRQKVFRSLRTEKKVVSEWEEIRAKKEERIYQRVEKEYQEYLGK